MIQRRGISLIEMLVVMTASVVVLGLIAGMIRMLMRADRAAEDHLVRSTTVDQLCHSFRLHVRAAVQADCTQNDGASGLQLKLGGESTVEFLAREHVVTRIEREAGQIRRQEKYTLPAGRAVQFEIRPDHNSTRVSLVIAGRPGRQDQGPLREFRIDATLDRDRRFVLGEE